jgi:Spy/CpxP family protein refolding chaperone
VIAASVLLVSGASLAGDESPMNRHGDGHGYHHGKECNHRDHQGHGHYRDGKVPGERWLSRMSEKLELTDDQRRDIETLMKEARDSGVWKRFHEASVALHGAMREDAGEEKLRELARAKADARVDLILQRRQVRERIHGVLSEEQRRQLEAMKTRKHEMFHKKMDRSESSTQ